MRWSKYIGSVIKDKKGNVLIVIGLIGTDFHVRHVPCRGYTSRLTPTKFKVLICAKR